MDAPAAPALSSLNPRVTGILGHIGRVFQGKPRIVELTLVTVIAGGHLLLEDVPGVGKTTLAMALARTMGMAFKRVQFTSDMLPADILGVSVWSKQAEAFEFVPGPIFSQIVLADEINRTTPRTQSALLEAMSEGRVSVDNVTHTLPAPFHVIATQNPLESWGTYPLPESQLDRFMMRLSIGYPSPEIELDLLINRRATEPVDALEAIGSPADYAALSQAAGAISLSPELASYVMEVVARTRTHPQVRVGVSTRGALALVRAMRALALIRGRTFCIPSDARELFVPCLAHRLSLGAQGPAPSRQAAEALTEDIAASVAAPS